MKRLFFAALLFNLLSATALAAGLQFAGYQLDAPQWRSPAAEKVQQGGDRNLDADGDGVLGTAGYLFFTPTGAEEERGTAPTDLSSLPMVRLPEWIRSVELLNQGADLVRLPQYAAVDDPSNPDQKIPSGVLVIKTQTPETMTPALRLVFGEKAPDLVRIGLMLDNMDAPVYSIAQFEAVSGQDSIGTVHTTVGTEQGNNLPDWYFIDVLSPKSGESVELRVQSLSALAGLGLMTLDASDKGASTGNPATPSSAPGSRQARVHLDSPYYGQFEHPGRYLKDYYVYKDNDTYHCFYNIGLADDKQFWQQPGNEEMFGHATSTDLRQWKIHPGVIITQPLTWEEATVSAPSILRHDGLYWMAYTGFDRNATQQIGMAVSQDLFEWERRPENPVFQGPAWTPWEAGKWADCRDADIVAWKDGFVMFNTVVSRAGKGKLSVAWSNNLIDWQDLGEDKAIDAGFHPAESPRGFVHDGRIYVFATSGHGRKLWISEDPLSGSWRELPFEFPGGGLWSGWEVVEGPEGQTIFSAFLWKTHGNFIRFWEVEWQEELPVLKH